MQLSQKKIRPDDYILSVIKPAERLEAALKIAAEAFKNSELSEEDITKAVKSIRKKIYDRKK